MKYEALIKKSSLSNFFSFEELKNLKTLNIKKHSLIYNPSDSDCVLFLLQGRVVCANNQSNKYIYIPYIFENNSFIGETLPSRPYKGTFDYFTLKDSILIYIPRALVDKWKKSNIEFINYLYNEQSKKDYYVHLYHHIRLQKGLKGIISFLLIIYSTNNLLTFKNMLFLTKFLNTTKKSLYNTLNELEEAGLIIRKNHKLIEIIKPEELKKIYEEDIFEF